MLPPRVTSPVVVIPPVACTEPALPTDMLANVSSAVFNCPPVTLTFESLGLVIVVVPPVTFRVPMVPVPPRVAEAELLSVVTFSAPPESRTPLPETFATGAAIAPPAARSTVPPEMSICVSPARVPVPLTARLPPVTETERLFSRPAVTFSLPPPVTLVVSSTLRLLMTLTIPVPPTVRRSAPSMPMRFVSTVTSPLTATMLFNWPGPVGPTFQWSELQLPVVPSQVRSPAVNRNTWLLAVLRHKFALFQAAAAPVSSVPLSTSAKPVTVVSPRIRSPS